MKDLFYLLALGGETAPIRIYASGARCGYRRADLKKKNICRTFKLESFDKVINKGANHEKNISSYIGNLFFYYG